MLQKTKFVTHFLLVCFSRLKDVMKLLHSSNKKLTVMLFLLYYLSIQIRKNFLKKYTFIYVKHLTIHLLTVIILLVFYLNNLFYML